MTNHEFDGENDFVPQSKASDPLELLPPAEERIASAAEYSAYQLGQIKVALRRIADALEKQNEGTDG